MDRVDKMKIINKVLLSFFIVIALFSIPFAIYKITPLPAITSGAGDSITWVNFWGNYLGGILGAGITAIVSYRILYKELVDHKKQIRVNQRTSYYLETKSACVSLINTLNPNRLKDYMFLLSNGLYAEAKKGVIEQFDDVTNAITLFNISVESYGSDEECKQFAKNVNDAVGRYLEILNLIEVLIIYSELSEVDSFNMRLIVNSYLNTEERYKKLLTGISVSNKTIDKKEFYKATVKLIFDLLDKYEIEFKGKDVKVYVLREIQTYLESIREQIDLMY